MNNYVNGLVSIVIPSYNSSKYVETAIKSCLSQTYKKIEIIIVDDGSTDDTNNLLKPYIDNGQIKYIYQLNTGLAGARNTGILNSNGEFIQFLDADDLIEKTKVEKQVNYLKSNSDCFGVYCRWGTFCQSKPDYIVPYTKELKKGLIQKYLIIGNIMPVNSVLARRAENILFDKSLKACEDWDYWFRLFNDKRKIGYIDEVLCLIRVHDNNMSSNKELMVKNDCIVLDKILNVYRENPAVKAKIKFQKFKRLFSIKDRECIECLKQAFCSKPLLTIMDFLYFVTQCVYFESRKIIKNCLKRCKSV